MKQNGGLRGTGLNFDTEKMVEWYLYRLDLKLEILESLLECMHICINIP